MKIVTGGKLQSAAIVNILVGVRTDRDKAESLMVAEYVGGDV